MRRRALAALLVIFVATPVPVLCAVCTPDACLMSMAPVMEEAGCHGMEHAAAVPDASLHAMTPDCCVVVAPAQDAVPAVPATTLGAPAPVPAQEAPPTPLALSPSSTHAPADESPPPEPLRPLYTLHSSLLI